MLKKYIAQWNNTIINMFRPDDRAIQRVIYFSWYNENATKRGFMLQVYKWIGINYSLKRCTTFNGIK